MSPSIAQSNATTERAREAFSAQAELFDSYDKANPILQWMRRQVYTHEEEFLLPGSAIFELNAGTGIDALYFAGKGHTVFAIDQADRMVQQFQKKAESTHMEEKISCVRCSFTELDSLPTRQFDHVFSNFGGLNCIPDLTVVARQLPRLLRPGATVTVVVMPRVCPWELLHVFSGNRKLAFRRFIRNGTPAQIEGHHFMTFYFSPADVVRAFAGSFTPVRLRGLASLSPPPYMSEFVLRHPRLYKVLTLLDELSSGLPPFNRWADHFILTLKYLPK